MLLKQEQGVAQPPATEETVKPEDSLASEAGPSSQAEADAVAEAAADAEESDDECEVSSAAYKAGRYSPVLLQSEDLEPGTLLTDPEDDHTRLICIQDFIFTYDMNPLYGPAWWVMAQSPYSIHREGLCSSSGDINRLMMMMIMYERPIQKACPENPEFAVLRFHAGPPYEDIAFKIVNREWEYSYKRGFRCHFHNNIFQLWFHFKRYRYRR
ncbi:hypothetical protein evm_015056 [Chilo suppressalis]|nr:hypothetical protein evm_015056 [Chilo suppressalis]